MTKASLGAANAEAVLRFKIGGTLVLGHFGERLLLLVSELQLVLGGLLQVHARLGKKE